MSNRILEARDAKATTKAMESLRVVLCGLNHRYPWRAFYWRNGIVREKWLHPRAGWTDRRWAAVAIPELSGVWNVPALKAEIKKRKAAQ